MKFYVIGDEDTVLGFSYAGVKGTVVETQLEAETAFEKAFKNPNIGIIIITERSAELIRKRVDNEKINAQRPLVVEIPDREGPMPGRKSILELIREAIGIRV